MMRHHVDANGSFPHFAGDETGIGEELLFICAANMAVCQNIATLSRCCVKVRKTLSEKNRSLKTHEFSAQKP